MNSSLPHGDNTPPEPSPSSSDPGVLSVSPPVIPGAFGVSVPLWVLMVTALSRNRWRSEAPSSGGLPSLKLAGSLSWFHYLKAKVGLESADTARSGGLVTILQQQRWHFERNSPQIQNHEVLDIVISGEVPASCLGSLLPRYLPKNPRIKIQSFANENVTCKRIFNSVLPVCVCIYMYTFYACMHV